MSKDKLSKRQASIYDYICAYTAEHGYAPSVREIGKAVGLASPSTVHMHLKVLEERQLIKRASNKPRTIEVKGPERPSDAVGVAPATRDVNVAMLSLPLVGRVAAGTPILAEQNVEEEVALPVSLVGDACSFLLRVRGSSMINKGILDGDVIAVHEQPDASDGDVVVALVDDGATVKTFYREKGRIRLQPENDAMEPIYATNPRIVGKVVALVRSLA
ncbi:transcriptional repressor LexA [Olsenella massiliensis]|uniref:transcriptional repressor LexA n=1 Tax=Olsenella massiliensis TaxID=1622075 RepID=UPI00071DC86D|nr:transcriptional repressor LexA [Olsenella massiliensis]